MRKTLVLIMASATLVWAGASAQQPTGQGQAPAGLPAPPLPEGPDVWRVDTSHTSAQFAVTHLLVSTVRGTLGPVTGWVKYDGKSPVSIATEVWIDTKGIHTGNQSRDNDLRSDNFLLVEQHPRIIFKSTRVEAVSQGRFRMIGDLTLRGVTREVALDVEGPSGPVRRAATGPTVVGARATATINRKDFGVKYNTLIEAGGAVVSDEVKITIDIEARQVAPAPGGR